MQDFHPPRDYAEPYRKAIPARDLQAIFVPRGRRPFLIPANDRRAPADVSHVGGWHSLVLMMAVVGAVAFLLATGGAL
jgi:hypothetical protein